MRFQDLPTASGIPGCCPKGQGLSHGATYKMCIRDSLLGEKKEAQESYSHQAGGNNSVTESLQKEKVLKAVSYTHLELVMASRVEEAPHIVRLSAQAEGFTEETNLTVVCIDGSV